MKVSSLVYEISSMLYVVCCINFNLIKEGMKNEWIMYNFMINVIVLLKMMK